jgi:FAD/FMN-containing dehydrogenase
VSSPLQRLSALETRPAAAVASAPARPRRPLERSLEYLPGWGGAVGAQSPIWRPADLAGLRQALEEARVRGLSIGLRGGGNSYGDAAVNQGGAVLDLTRMNRLLGFDRDTGVAEVEPGVTIEQLWKTILPLGFWPKVVSGTMFPTVAGAAAMNIHGKNNFKVGTIGDALLEFDLLLADGQLLTCSRETNPDLFHAAIGGFGMLGVMTRLKLRTQRVHSGDLEVRAISCPDLGAMMAAFEERKSAADYLVGWVDCFASGRGLGRGLIHEARYLAPGEDPAPERTLALAHQELPSRILGLFPKSQVWRCMAPICNDLGLPVLNATKHFMGRREAAAPPYRQSHAGFAFLLDYVPNWKRAYGPGGLIQYQSFLPVETAHETYRELLTLNQRRGLVPYLGVFKRHRPDPFWLTHAVDGWSFAMDFRVTRQNREALWRHTAELTERVLAAGGRFYFAKDLVLGKAAVERMFPADRREAFLALKRRLDPELRLQTNLWRRLFDA